MTSPLTFAEDSSIDEIRAEAWEIDSMAMIEAMNDIAQEEGIFDPYESIVLD